MAEHKRLKIFLIEDDQALCEGWRELFELSGFELVCHPNAKQALTDVSSIQSTNIVISDYYLPDLNGVELIRRLRHINPDVPVILLTGSREKTIVDSASLLPGCKILYKPVDIDALEEQIHKMVMTSSSV